MRRSDVTLAYVYTRGIPRGYESQHGEVVCSVNVPLANAGRFAAGLGDVQQTHWRVGWGGAEDQDGKTDECLPAWQRSVVYNAGVVLLGIVARCCCVGLVYPRLRCATYGAASLNAVAQSPPCIWALRRDRPAGRAGPIINFWFLYLTPRSPLGQGEGYCPSPLTSGVLLSYSVHTRLQP